MIVSLVKDFLSEMRVKGKLDLSFSLGINAKKKGYEFKQLFLNLLKCVSRRSLQFGIS